MVRDIETEKQTEKETKQKKIILSLAKITYYYPLPPS